MMAFTVPINGDGALSFSLEAAGEQYQRNEKPIRIQDVRQTGDITVTAETDGENVEVTAPPGTRVRLMVSLDRPDESYWSYRPAPPRESRE